MSTAILSARNVSPRYTHDCAKCRFLARLNDFDIYLCKDRSVCARFGNADSAYGAMPLDMAHCMPGTKYAFAAMIVDRAEVQGARFRPNAYRCDTLNDAATEDREPDSGDLEREWDAERAAETRAI